MSLRKVLLIALASTIGPSHLWASSPREPQPARQRSGALLERLAQGRPGDEVPGGLPGRSESSGESGAVTRGRSLKAAKPAADKKATKAKEKSREGNKDRK
jgi:hypothetical protein